MAKEKETKATARAEETALVPQTSGGEVAMPLEEMWAADAGAGMEGIGANDMALPFLTILQKGSPQVSRSNAKYIKGAESGNIINTVTGAMYSGIDGILFVPCGYQKKIVHWRDREDGGGFLGHISPNDPKLQEAKANDRGRLELPDGTFFEDTAYHFGLLLRDESVPEYAIISMKSTGMKASRNWNTLMKGILKKAPNGVTFNPPSFSHIYKLTTVGQVKDTFDWFGWQVQMHGELKDPEIYKMARKFAQAVALNEVRISKPIEEFEGPGDYSDSEDGKKPF